jgi:integrase
MLSRVKDGSQPQEREAHTAIASAALRDHLSRHLEEIDCVSSLYSDAGLVFATENGTLVNSTNRRQRSFAPLLKRANLRKMRFHDLRHTCATLMLSRNVHPKIVQEMLGHATIAITLDRYSHVLPAMGRDTALAMDKIFS